MENLKVPQHFRFIIPIVEVLKELGGSGSAGEVTDLVVERLNIPEEELNETIKSGASRIKNQIQWARLVLAKTDYLDSSQRGVWSLTEKGYKANLSELDLAHFYELKKQWNRGGKKPPPNDSEDDGEPSITQEEAYKSELLDVLKSIPPEGFERICQLLLRESGFEQVNVTGKSGDGGIDGIGICQVNDFVSFKVLFQCKRYQGSVGSGIVRDFRGAMMGRADKGIILTTGMFTKEAKNEARRDGVPQIELVDGDRLVDMFKEKELGLKPVKTFAVDYEFFEKYDYKPDESPK